MQMTVNMAGPHRNTTLLAYDVADDLAKQGSMLAPHKGGTSWAYWKSQARADLKTAWENHSKGKAATYTETFGWKVRQKLDLPPDIPRKTGSAFYQLKIAHGYFKSYLSRFKITVDAKCQCGYRSQDPKHLLIYCPIYSLQRKRIRRDIQGRLTLQTLLGTKKGIALAVQFLQDRSIATRDWHQEESSTDNSDEEEEGETEEGARSEGEA